MPDLNARLAILAKEPPEAQASILLDSLTFARPEERPALYRGLLETGQHNAISALMRMFDTLPDDVKEQLVDSNADVLAASDGILAHGSEKATENTIEVLAERQDPAAAPVFAKQLTSDSKSNARHAAKAFLELVVATVGPRGTRQINPEQRLDLDTAAVSILDAKREHRLDAALLAVAILAARPKDPLRDIIDDDDHPARLALAGVCEHVQHPLVRTNLIFWLGIPALQRPAARWLHRVDTPDALEDLLATAHLLQKPQRRKAMRRADRPVRCVPAPAVAASLTETAMSRLPQYVAALGLSSRQRIRALVDLTLLDGKRCRLHALNIMLAHQSDEVDRAAIRLCEDPEPAIARLAATRAFARQTHFDHVTLQRLTQSPHSFIANRAQARRAEQNVDAFFNSWMELPRNHRLVAAHRLLHRDRAGLMLRLNKLLREGERPECLAVIYLSRRLGIIDAIERQLVRHTRHHDPRVSSASVAALADGRGGERLAALRDALKHNDQRVRANAVEALVRAAEVEVAFGRDERIRLAAIQLIMPHTEAVNNRERANAIRGLIKSVGPLAVEKLHAMLTDNDPLHRISAMWVARRSRATVLLPLVQHLAQHDAVPAVRQRAEAACTLLKAASRHASQQNENDHAQTTLTRNAS